MAIVIRTVIAILLLTVAPVMAAPTPKAPGGVPSPAEFGLLRAKLAQFGWSQAAIDACIGTTPSGRDRATITETLKGCIANLPKGQ